MTEKSPPSCRDCKHLVRFKVPDDIFWHYRCNNYPNAKNFDDWKSLTMGRSETECGYKKKEDKCTKNPWQSPGGLSVYPFENRYYDKIKGKK